MHILIIIIVVVVLVVVVVVLVVVVVVVVAVIVVVVMNSSHYYHLLFLMFFIVVAQRFQLDLDVLTPILSADSTVDPCPDYTRVADIRRVDHQPISSRIGEGWDRRIAYRVPSRPI